MSKEQKPGIRYDLFGVKEWDYAIGDWSMVYICDSMEVAKHMKGLLTGRRKIVHPAQWVVNGFLAYGNHITTNTHLWGRYSNTLLRGTLS